MPDNDNDIGTPSRRDVMKTGASLWAVPSVLAAAGAVGATGAASAAVPSMQRAAPPASQQGPVALADPKAMYPRPPFKPQQQELPGLASKMDPPPDHGEKSYRGSGKLIGRHALVTGGDSGIGRAAAIAFAREGADVAISYLPAEESDAQDVVAIIRAEGRVAVALPGDITDEAFCQKLVADAVAGLGGLDILVNNAGTQYLNDSITDITTEHFDRTFKVNVYAPFWITKAAVPHMPAGASIINTASIQAYDPSPTLLDYAQTKACNVSFTKSLAQQLMDKGIRVNAVAPGPFWTPLQPASVKSPEGVVDMGKGNPFGRPGQPVELAGTFVFLASNESSYMTGEVMGSTGGKAPF